MTLYNILKSFKGSQDGRFCEDFEAGTQRELSDYLYDCIDKAWVAPAAAAPEAAVIENKAVATDGNQPKSKRTEKTNAK
jgi:hypothetical protein